MQPQLTESEACLIVDALNGVLIDPPQIAEQLIWQEVEEAIKLDKLDEKWHVDGPALVEKLKALDNAEANALLARVAEFWSAYQATDSRVRVRAIGLANAVEGDELITMSEAAKVSGRSLSELSQLANRGKLDTFTDPDEPNRTRANRVRLSQVKALPPKRKPKPAAKRRKK